MQKILIYGVGNPFRCDDSVGMKVANALEEKIKKSNIIIKSGSIDGLTMLDEIRGFGKVIVVDSIKTKDGKPGDIYRITLEPLKNAPSLSATHGIDFVTALRLGKKLGYTMPKSVNIYAIEIEDNTTFSEDCTEKVKTSIPEVVEKVLEEITAITR